MPPNGDEEVSARFRFPWEVNRNSLKAIAHAMNRVAMLNGQWSPVTVSEVRVGGSAILGTPRPADVDLVVVASPRQGPIASEWKLFRGLLRETYSDVFQLLDELRLIEGRASMGGLLALYWEELESLGFRPEWLEYWMPWVRVSDYWHVHNIGIITGLIDEKTLVRRYITYGWGRSPRLEIHFAGDFALPGEDIPAITLWTQESGPRTPGPSEIESFVLASYERIRSQAIRISESSFGDLPDAYIVVARVLNNPDIPRHLILARLHAKTVQTIHEAIDELAQLARSQPRTLEEHRMQAIAMRSLEKRIIALALLADTLASLPVGASPRLSKTLIDRIKRIYIRRALRKYGLARDTRKTLQEILTNYVDPVDPV